MWLINQDQEIMAYLNMYIYFMSMIWRVTVYVLLFWNPPWSEVWPINAGSKNADAGYSASPLQFSHVGHELNRQILGPRLRWWFHPDPWGRWTRFDEHFFQMGWLKPPTSDTIDSRSLTAKAPENDGWKTTFLLGFGNFSAMSNFRWVWPFSALPLNVPDFYSL